MKTISGNRNYTSICTWSEQNSASIISLPFLLHNILLEDKAVCGHTFIAGGLFKDCYTKKTHLLNCKRDTSVNITSPAQFQDGITYDSNNIGYEVN